MQVSEGFSVHLVFFCETLPCKRQLISRILLHLLVSPFPVPQSGKHLQAHFLSLKDQNLGLPVIQYLLTFVSYIFFSFFSMVEGLVQF